MLESFSHRSFNRSKKHGKDKLWDYQGKMISILSSFIHSGKKKLIFGDVHISLILQIEK